MRGYGLRVPKSTEGSDSWVDDPITRHVISLLIDTKEEGELYLLWPFILHIRGPYCILVLPLVEPRHLKAYTKLCRKSDCGNAVGVDRSLSSLLLDLPSITGYGKFLVMLIGNTGTAQQYLLQLFFSIFFFSELFWYFCLLSST